MPRGVRRGQCHLQRRAVALEVELERLAATDETADRATEPMLIPLEAMADARLHDSLTVLELRHEHEERVEVVRVQRVRTHRDDAAEEQWTEPGRRVDRKHPMAECDAPSRRVRAAVEHLELGQDHLVQPTGRVCLLSPSAGSRVSVAITL
jgi:hypothetical protein